MQEHARALLTVAVLFSSMTFPVGASAYVGPGLGLGVLGAIAGVLVTIFLAIAGVVWYPVKRLRKKRADAKRTREDARAARDKDAGATAESEA